MGEKAAATWWPETVRSTTEARERFDKFVEKRDLNEPKGPKKGRRKKDKVHFKLH